MSGWTEASLGEVCELYQPKTISSSELVEDGPFPVYGANGVIGKYDKFNHEDPQLLITCRGATCGAVNISQPKSWINGNAMVVKPRNKSIDVGFLKHLFLGGIDLSAVITGAAQPQITRQSLAPLKIRFPNPAEQQRLISILDQADALRAKRREALVQLDSLTQSIFIEMFGDPITNPKGWLRVRFASLLANIDSGWSPVCMDRAAEGEEWGVLKLGAVTSCKYKDSENKALPEGVPFDPKIEVKSGDLLFSRKNTYDLVAACALVESTREHLMLSDLIFRFRLNSDAKIEKHYLQSLMVFPSKRSEVQKLAGGSSGSMPNISKGRLLELEIELPPLSLQRTFATRVQSLEALKVTHNAALQELDRLVASLQHRAFQGEL